MRKSGFSERASLLSRLSPGEGAASAPQRVRIQTFQPTQQRGCRRDRSQSRGEDGRTDGHGEGRRFRGRRRNKKVEREEEEEQEEDASGSAGGPLAEDARGGHFWRGEPPHLHPEFACSAAAPGGGSG